MTAFADDIYVLSIGRPHKRNALRHEDWQSLCDALDLVAGQEHWRALILWPEGKHFCAGADLEELQAQWDSPAWMRANQALIAHAQQKLYRLRVPTMAVISGSCFGGGVGLASACDFRIATPDARFALTPAKLGLSYPMRDCQRLLALIGPAQTRALLLAGQSLNAKQAHAAGLLNACVEPEALEPQLAAWVECIRAGSAAAQAALKATLLELEDQRAGDDASAQARFYALLEGPEFKAAAQAFLRK